MSSRRIGPAIFVGGVCLIMIGGLFTAVVIQKNRNAATTVASDVQPQSKHPTTKPAGISSAELADRVLAMKSDAESLALSRNFTGSAAKYRQIHQILDAHRNDDVLLKNLAQQIDQGERNLNRLQIAQTKPAPVAVAPKPIQSGGMDFGPARSFASTAPTPTTRPAATQPATPAVASAAGASGSDFNVKPIVPSNQPNKLVPASAVAQMEIISDEQIGQAIQRGVNFLLSQFKDGEISPDTELSDSQRESLDALCVYALLQSGQSVNDPRLSIKGDQIPRMLDKLRAYDLTSDGKTTNRPITYGRSLRAAALATLNRNEDRDTLKKDVAWLIQSQIGGAYSYDDLYLQLVAKGMKPVEQTGGALARNPAANQPANPTPQDFGGSSAPPPVDTGPYGEPGPRENIPMTSPPPSIAVVGGGGSIAGGGKSGKPTKEVPIQWKPVLTWVPFPRPYMHTTPPPPPRMPTPTAKITTPQIPGYRYIPPALNDGIDAKIPPTLFVFPWDNSNSQYGLLGVWAGAEVGMEVPDAYWKAVEHHWVTCQLANGQWAYHQTDPHGYYSMTCAGVASLLVTHDYLDIPQLKGAIGRPPYSPSLTAGIAWLDQGDNGVSTPGPNTYYMGYDLFGIERVGLASGYKYFGTHDWYRELAARTVPLQFPNGSFGHEDHGNDCVIDTAYTLLFLSRGRHPVMMTKLKFDKFWDNRPRDVANLAKFAGKELERPLNWQVVGINHDWSDWFDSPVLYIASHQPPQFKEEDYRRLRSFVLAGGLIFTQADGSSAAFNAWVPELARHIAPGYALKPLPDNSPIYGIQYKITSHPPMMGVSNGSRLLLVHSPVDLSLHWQERSTKTFKWAFELGTNIFVYASGKPELRNRLNSPYIPPAPTAPAQSVPIALLQYDGNWDPEPAAWFRFSRYMQWETGLGIDPRPMSIESLTPTNTPIASLTGTDAVQFSPVQLAALHSYVQAGGILLIDSVGGENAFSRIIRDNVLPSTFADAAEQPLTADSPLFKDLKPGLANDSPVRLRAYAIDRLGRNAPQIRMLKLGKGYVIFSPLDLTSALLGTNTWGILGYEPVSGQKFAKNLVLWEQKG